MNSSLPDIQKAKATRDRIVASAETLFANAGYEGASTRKIAEAAGVPAGLVNYHFKSKEGLYRAVFENRAGTISDQRMAGLHIADMEPDSFRRAELVVRAMLMPMFQMRANTRNATFGRLLVREVIDPHNQKRGIMRDMFDPVALKVIEALADCFPDWTKAEMHWAYQTMLGVMCQIISDNGRIEHLSDGAASADDADAAIQHVSAILVAGFKHRKRELPRGRATKT